MMKEIANDEFTLKGLQELIRPKAAGSEYLRGLFNGIELALAVLGDTPFRPIFPAQGGDDDRRLFGDLPKNRPAETPAPPAEPPKTEEKPEAAAPPEPKKHPGRPRIPICPRCKTREKAPGKPYCPECAREHDKLYKRRRREAKKGQNAPTAPEAPAAPDDPEPATAEPAPMQQRAERQKVKLCPKCKTRLKVPGASYCRECLREYNAKWERRRRSSKINHLDSPDAPETPVRRRGGSKNAKLYAPDAPETAAPEIPNEQTAETQYDRLLAECKRRGYDPDILLGMAKALPKVDFEKDGSNVRPVWHGRIRAHHGAYGPDIEEK